MLNRESKVFRNLGVIIGFGLCLAQLKVYAVEVKPSEHSVSIKKYFDDAEGAIGCNYELCQEAASHTNGQVTVADCSTPMTQETLSLARALAKVPKEFSAFASASMVLLSGRITRDDDGSIIYQLTGRSGTIDVDCGPTILTVTGKPVSLPFGPGTTMTYTAIFDASKTSHGHGCP